MKDKYKLEKFSLLEIYRFFVILEVKNDINSHDLSMW